MRKELLKFLCSAAEDWPGVNIGLKLNSTNFSIRKKVFAFTKGEAIVLKLPQKKIEDLIVSQSAVRLVMGKRIMREWVVIGIESTADVRRELANLKEAMTYVLAGAKKEAKNESKKIKRLL